MFSYKLLFNKEKNLCILPFEFGYFSIFLSRASLLNGDKYSLKWPPPLSVLYIHCLIKMMIIIYKTMFIKTKGTCNWWWSSSWCQLVNRHYKVHFIKQKFQNKIFLNVKAYVLFWFRKTLLSLNTLYIIILFWNFSIFTLITRSWRETIPIYRNYTT